MTVKTRFAPSPTGHLHVGGVRTALFSWLHARKNNGEFILRIEDTDLARSTQESVQAILDGMQWLGLNYDAGPFYQTQRFDRYQEVINRLLEQGDAYRCYCLKQELEQLRTEQMARKEKPRYDGRCRSRSEQETGSAFVVRFRNPLQGQVTINDFVKGDIVIQNSELDDLIIARSDGTPTYNLTVVVDDLDMGVSVVIRGDDHINNTPRQINMIQALGAKPPEYGHVPMILGSDGARLSKRHGAVSVMQYRDEGYLPQALLNYLVRLGWSHGDQEIFSVDEMINLFDIQDVNQSASTFNPEKLLWLNHQYIMNEDSALVASHLSWYMETLGVDLSTGPELAELVKIQRERSKTLVEMAEACAFFYRDIETYDEKAVKKNFKAHTKDILEHLAASFAELNTWRADILHNLVLETADKFQVKLGQVAQPIRIALTGTSVSPAIDQTLALMGQEKTVARLRKAIIFLEQRA